ncbi:MAG: sulfate adenylyltransferase subunit CysD [Cytophagales bacterium]|nr:sulfate adenylyltransferase subunit CysD [Rhizobacter sp.]
MNSEAAVNLEQWNARRKRAVELRAAGRSLPDIRQETGLSAPTIIAAYKAYLDGGWDAVPVQGRGRKHGVGRVLDAAQEHALRMVLRQAPEAVGVSAGVWTLAHTALWIQTKFGLQIEDRTLSRYLVRWGLALEPWRRAASATEAGATWWAATLPELVKTARSRAAQVVWCCATPMAADDTSSTPSTLLRAQTLRGRVAWGCLPGDVNAQALWQLLSLLADELEAPLCVALNAPQLPKSSWPLSTSARVAVWGCPIGTPVSAPASPAEPTPFAVAPSPSAPPTEPTRARAPRAPAPISTPSETPVAMNTKLTHLQHLEAESIHILREVVAECENPVMLYSIGKDSSVMLHLARKAFFPAPPPFPLLHVDTTWKFREMYAMRERMAAESDMKLLVHQNPEAVALGISPFVHGSQIHTDLWKTQGLKQALSQHGFDAAFGGARRDEEKSRAKERIFSFRSTQHRWDPKNQRPELWHLYNARMHKGESMRVFPISNWTELDVWQYIYLENIPIVPLYFAKERPVVERDGSLIMVDDERMPLKAGETPQMRKVRFRTLGCYPLTGAVESTAQTLPEIIQEMLLTRTSERQGRVIDHDSSGSMEKKKQEGYF